MKRIVIFCDGTWNNPRRPKQTNVSKLYGAVVEREEEPAQHRWYDEGVGSEGSRLKQIFSAVLGRGLDTNVRQAYAEIARHFEAEGDEIYLFGFSRGAYTARSTLGMIRKCGLLADPSARNVGRAWNFYRGPDHPESEAARRFRLGNSRVVRGGDGHVPLARFIGVWDTVGALGVPIRRFRKRYDFHDVALTSWVENAFQALAIDDRRRDYAPTLWAQNPDPEAVRGQRLEQRWFAGVHSDVGGGAGHEGDDEQSDYCLKWILDQAAACGLAIDEGRISWTAPRQPQNRHIHDNGFAFKLLNFFRGRYLREIGAGVQPPTPGAGGRSNEAVDGEVLRRQQTDPDYDAPNVDAFWSANPEALREAQARIGPA